MIERKVQSAPIDTFKQVSQAGVMQANAKQKSTQRFFQNMGAFTQERVEAKRDEEREEYDHKTKLQTRIFNGNLNTLNSVLQGDDFRDKSMDELKETSEYKEAIASLSTVNSDKTKEQLQASLEATLGNIHDTHTAKKENETMDSLAFTAFNKTPDGDEYDEVIEESAAEVGYERTYDVAATEAISSLNLARAKVLFNKEDPRMDDATKARLNSFIQRAEAKAKEEASKNKVDIGRLEVHMSDTKDPEIGYKILDIMKANGDKKTKEYGIMQGKIDLLERRKGKMKSAQTSVYQGATPEEIKADYGLEDADVKELVDQSWERAQAEFASGNPEEMERLLKTNPALVSKQVTATINATMSRLSSISPEEIDNLPDNDPRLQDFQKLLQIGEMSYDTTLAENMGGKYEDYVLLRSDYKNGDIKYALSELKERQSADAVNSKATDHVYWASTRNDIIESLTDDMSDELRDKAVPFLRMKADDFARRYSTDQTQKLMEDYVGRFGTFEYDGDDVLFTKSIDNAATALNIVGYDTEPSELYGAFNEYALAEVQKEYPTVEGIRLVPSAQRNDWMAVVVTDGIGMPTKSFYVQDLVNQWKKTNKTKRDAARDNVQGER